MKKKLLVVTSITALSLMAITSSRIALAEGESPWHDTIVQKIANRFGLKQEEVQSVFSEARLERQDQMQSRFEQRLAQDVEAGKITESQKQAIIDKHNELRERYVKPENWQNLSPESRQSLMHEKRTELENWAKDNGIDMGYFFGGAFGIRSGRGYGRHGF